MKQKGPIMTDIDTSKAAAMRAKCSGMVLHGEHPNPAEVVEALEELQARAEQAEAERDELDFILNEGGEDSFAKVISRAEQAEARVKDFEGALRDMIEGYEEYNLSNGNHVLRPIEKQSSWIQRARAVLLQEEPKP